MNTLAMSPNRRRALRLAGDLQRRALLLVAEVPSDDAALRDRILAQAGVAVSPANAFRPRDALRILVPEGLELGRATIADVRRTSFTLESLGMTLDQVAAAQREERERRLNSAEALVRVGLLSRLREPSRFRTNALGHIADSLVLFEALPAETAHFGTVHRAIALGSGLVTTEDGYRLRGVDGVERGAFSDSELSAASSRASLRISAAKNRTAFLGTIELIIALLAHEHQETEGADALAAQASRLGIDIEGVGGASRPGRRELEPLAAQHESVPNDAALRWSLRRASFLRALLTPAIQEAERVLQAEEEARIERERLERAWAAIQKKEADDRAANRRAAELERRSWRLEEDASSAEQGPERDADEVEFDR